MSDTKKVLIIYPAVFRSYSKFSRKCDYYLQNLNKPQLIASDDHNDYVRQYAQERDHNLLTADAEQHPDYALVFDDGEEFPGLVEELRAKGVVVKKVAVRITRVINIRRDTRCDTSKDSAVYEYIGRGSYWGNPHSMYEEGEDREEVIRKFQYDFEYEKFPNKDKQQVYRLAGKRLGCFCKPAPCHGDVLADFLNAWDDGQ